MTVHKSCYGIDDPRQANKWYCDTCRNDKKESVSYVSRFVISPGTEANVYRLMSVFFALTRTQIKISMSNPR